MNKFFSIIALMWFISLHATNLFIDSPHPNHKIEVLVQKPACQKYPLLLFLHGASGKGLGGFSKSWFDHWLEKGYAVAAISMPGYGKSTGKKDFCGPFTIDTVNFAIDAIKKELNVSEFGVIGFGQGSLAGVLLSAKRNDISCLVCSNGGYDFFRHKKQGDALMNIIQENGYDLDVNDDYSLELRSAILHVSNINAPVFILHRKDNSLINEEEATDFYHAMLSAGKKCFLVIKDKTPECDAQKLSYGEVLSETEAWVDSIMIQGIKEGGS